MTLYPSLGSELMKDLQGYGVGAVFYRFSAPPRDLFAMKFVRRLVRSRQAQAPSRRQSFNENSSKYKCCWGTLDVQAGATIIGFLHLMESFPIFVSLVEFLFHQRFVSKAGRDLSSDKGSRAVFGFFGPCELILTLLYLIAIVGGPVGLFTAILKARPGFVIPEICLMSINLARLLIVLCGALVDSVLNGAFHLLTEDWRLLFPWKFWSSFGAAFGESKKAVTFMTFFLLVALSCWFIITLQSLAVYLKRKREWQLLHPGSRLNSARSLDTLIWAGAEIQRKPSIGPGSLMMARGPSADREGIGSSPAASCSQSLVSKSESIPACLSLAGAGCRIRKRLSIVRLPCGKRRSTLASTWVPAMAPMLQRKTRSASVTFGNVIPV